jgi:RNA polymerase sigma-70 factor (ECF subfamily)
MFQSLDAAAEEDECSDYTPLFLSDWREVPSEVLERKEIRQEIATALATLPVNYRELLVLRDIQHLNIAETAETLGISKGTVKIRLWRARLKMRDILAPKLAGVLKKPRAFWKGIRPW